MRRLPSRPFGHAGAGSRRLLAILLHPRLCKRRLEKMTDGFVQMNPFDGFG